MSEVTQSTETKKITQEESDKLKSFQERFTFLANQLGGLELQLQDAEETRKQILKRYEEHKEETNGFVKGLEEKYGKVSINLQTGEISDLKP